MELHLKVQAYIRYNTHTIALQNHRSMRKVAEDCLQTKLLHEMLVKVKRQNLLDTHEKAVQGEEKIQRSYC